MKINNINLVTKDGAAVADASVELSSKAEGSKYFGTWYKVDTTEADVVGWCDKYINYYQNFIKNLQAVKATSQLKMVKGMNREQLQEILDQMPEA